MGKDIRSDGDPATHVLVSSGQSAIGCGGPRTGYSLYAGSGQTLSSPGVGN